MRIFSLILLLAMPAKAGILRNVIPADSSITTSKLSDGSVTTSKLHSEALDPGGDLLLQASGGNVAIGTGTPRGTLHVMSGASGAGLISTNSDDFIIENNASGGFTILVPDASDANFFFGSPGDIAGAIMRWNHNANLMTVGTANTGDSLILVSGNIVEAIRIDSNQNIGLGSDSPGALVQIGDDSLNKQGVLLFEATDGDNVQLAITTGDTLEITGGLTQIGTGSSGATATAENDLLVEDALEVDGPTDLDGTLDVAGLTNFSAANVGINDASADAQLEVLSNSAETGFIVAISSQNDTTGNIFIIRGDGNVGIGVTDPATTLEVLGANSDALRLGTSSDGIFYQIGRGVGGFLEFKGSQATATGYDFISDDDTSLLTIIDSGNVGIGLTNPVARLEIESAAEINGYALLVSSTNESVMWGVKGNGHVASDGGTPAVTSCGTSPSIAGNDHAGKVTIGSSASSTCTLTFDEVYSAAPSCIFTNGTIDVPIFGTTTTSAITIVDGAGDFSSDVIMYICIEGN